MIMLPVVPFLTAIVTIQFPSSARFTCWLHSGIYPCDFLYPPLFHLRYTAFWQCLVSVWATSILLVQVAAHVLPIVVTTSVIMISLLILVPLSVRVPPFRSSPLIVVWRVISIILASWVFISPLDVVVSESSLWSASVPSPKPVFFGPLILTGLYISYQCYLAIKQVIFALFYCMCPWVAHDTMGLHSAF